MSKVKIILLNKPPHAVTLMWILQLFYFGNFTINKQCSIVMHSVNTC